MIFLILTNPEHVEFVRGTVIPYAEKSRDNIFIVKDFKSDSWGEGRYDIGISFMYQHRVPKEEIDKHPWFNFHPAPLPEYKGRNLCYHAIMNGETEFGASLHYMDENFDTGDIIHVGKFAIEEWMTAEDVSDLALAMSESLFTWFLPRIFAGEQFERIPNVGGTYYQKLPIDDVVHVSGNVKRWIRAIYYPPHCLRINIGGVMYKIVKE